MEVHILTPTFQTKQVTTPTTALVIVFNLSPFYTPVLGPALFFVCLCPVPSHALSVSILCLPPFLFLKEAPYGLQKICKVAGVTCKDTQAHTHTHAHNL